MKSRAVLFGAALIVALACTTYAQTEITLLSPNPIEDAVNTLVADFEAKTGTHVAVTYGTGVSTRNTVATGHALDVSLLFSPFPEALRTGNIIPNSATVIATLRLGVAVKKGAPKPDISTADAVRRTLLSATSIAAIDPERGSAAGSHARLREGEDLSGALVDVGPVHGPDDQHCDQQKRELGHAYRVHAQLNPCSSLY